MKNTPKPFLALLIALDIVLPLLSLLHLATVLLGDRKDLSFAIIEVALAFLVCLVLTLAFVASGSVNLLYTDNAVKYRIGQLVVKSIPYSRIEGASIETAVEPKYHTPYKDYRHETKRAHATLVLYESDVSYRHCVMPNSTYPLHSRARLNALCDDFLKTDDLQILLAKTSATVYITEEIASLYKSELAQILDRFPNRFVVVYFDEIDKQIKRTDYATYADYLKRL